ncbi:MAG: hypothetical protein L7S72_06905, partial [Flavobacteriales bacterium]|nr:hypothetical protein [Flavobacteriales bacterium]
TNSFNDELMKLLQEEESKQNEETCLISGDKLEDNFVKLECKHKFNYKDIYNEVHKQKTQPWHSEINKVKTTQLKCPYCRNIQNGVLPYREGFTKVKYVNWPPSLMMLPDECGYTFASGKRKGQTCNKKCSGKYCLSHTRIMERREKKRLEKEKKKLEKEKKKLEKEKAKIKPSIGGLAVVNWEKLEQQFVAAKDSSIAPHAANANALAIVQAQQIIDVTTSNSIPLVVTCSYKFKKGKNKGEKCPSKKIHNDGLCKFHYKKYVKEMEKKKNYLEKVNSNIKIKTVKFNQNQNLVITI